MRRGRPVLHRDLRMCCFRGRAVIILCKLFAESALSAQNAPAIPDHPWNASLAKPSFKAPQRLYAASALDPAKIYTLSELVNIGEENNPETRVAWQNAKARAADVGIAQSTLYPTLSASALARSTRFGMFYGTSFEQQTIETFSPVFLLDYIIFDFGQRSERVAASRSNLLAANFHFNDAHRKIIFQVMQAYYQLLDSKGQQDAAEADLENALTVQQATEDRLQHGLATLPDLLEARNAAAHADYVLQAAIGATEIAHGDLATALGVPPTAQFQVESIRGIRMPDRIDDTVETSIDKALSQRPDLIRRVAELRAAEAEVKAARRNYSPVLSIDGHFGLDRSYGVQVHLPGVYSPTIKTWDAEISLTWTLFDGLAREKRVAEAQANRKQAVAAVDSLRDQVENQVWSAYTTARTAFRQQRAATALLAAATESYNAALKSYNYGLRTEINVVAAQRALADARAADVNARTQLLTALAALSYQTGELLYARHP